LGALSLGGGIANASHDLAGADDTASASKSAASPLTTVALALAADDLEGLATDAEGDACQLWKSSNWQ